MKPTGGMETNQEQDRHQITKERLKYIKFPMIQKAHSGMSQKQN
jgi:hypothetical protein